MIGIEYRILLGGRALGRADLDRVETVTVKRSVREPGEADIEIVICAANDGQWLDAGTDLVDPGRRLRIEVRIGVGAFRPIFEGSSLGVDMRMTAEPSGSVQHLRAYDDTALLHLDEPDQGPLQGALKNLVRALLDRCESFRGEVHSIDVTDDTELLAAPKGSTLATIDDLAQRYHRLFYVTPGNRAGYSIACFKKPKLEVSTRYPPLVLMGRDRNVDSFETSHEYSVPGNTSAAALRLDDLSVAKRNAKLADGKLLGNRSALPSRFKPGRRMPHPLSLLDEQLVDTVADRETEESGYLATARARLRTREYGAIVDPDTLLVVTGAERSRCGTYYVESVDHTLDRSEYVQTLALRRNAAQTAAGFGTTLRGV